jgi:hypothetical protein
MFANNREAWASYINTCGEEKATMEVSLSLSFGPFVHDPTPTYSKDYLMKCRDSYLVHAMLVHECIEGRKHFVEHDDQILGC